METANFNGSEEMIVCEVVSEEIVRCKGEQYHSVTLYPPTDGRFWMFIILYLVLVLFAGLMSGLTMGLLSLDKMSLEVLKRGGKPRQKKFATRILMIVKRHHLLLVTLLLANALAVETMPIFLSKITVEVVAIIISVTAVLLFGEIIPQALCTRFGLAIGYYCSPIVIVLMIVFLPLAYPISLVLDLILGHGHGTFFRRAELRELVKMHGAHDHEDPLTFDEVLILKGALDMRYKTVADSMTPLESVYMLNITGKIDGATMRELLQTGHSRVPVYKDKQENICGLLLVKKLIQLDPEDCTPIQTLDGAQTPPPSCLTTTPLYELLNLFQTGRSHLYIVYKEGEDETDLNLVGIITLEDVIEELIGEEIVDETDQYVDVHRRIAVARARLANIRHTASAPAQGQRKSGPAQQIAKSKKGRPRFLSSRSQSLPDAGGSLTSPPEPLHTSKSPSLNSNESETQQEPVELMSTEGGFSLETIYEAAATPTAAINASVPDDSAQDSDESEQAPLITGR